MSQMPAWNLSSGLDGQGVIVTGAAGGIGSVIAQMFAASGARVFALDRDREGVERVVDGLDGHGHFARQVDLAKIDEIAATVSEARSLLGELNTLAHPAAALRRQPIEDVTEADWDLQHDVNLKATFFLNRAVADVMVEQGKGGRIINFTSTVWQTGSRANADAYAISKGGVVTLTRDLSYVYGKHGILVNAISPGQIDTPMQRSENTPEALAAGMANCPLGRMGQPSEVAAVVLFLASNHASFVSGSTITVSGGATPW